VAVPRGNLEFESVASSQSGRVLVRSGMFRGAPIPSGRAGARWRHLHSKQQYRLDSPVVRTHQ
jgi:hypothetical protein